jgi:hypothetical protein
MTVINIHRERQDGNTTLQTLPLHQVRDDGGTQSRTSINDEVVKEYADAIVRGERLPPVVVFYDGSAYWLADGFHRLRAHKKSGEPTIEVDIRQGTQRDAVLYAFGANKGHGLRMSNADKRNAVLRLLRDEEWSQWSDNAIAKHVGVDHKTVAKHRAESNLGNPKSKKGADGRVINTSKIGKAQRKNTAQERVRAERLAHNAHSKRPFGEGLDSESTAPATEPEWVKDEDTGEVFCDGCGATECVCDAPTEAEPEVPRRPERGGVNRLQKMAGDIQLSADVWSMFTGPEYGAPWRDASPENVAYFLERVEEAEAALRRLREVVERDAGEEWDATFAAMRLGKMICDYTLAWPDGEPLWPAVKTVERELRAMTQQAEDRDGADA